MRWHLIVMWFDSSLAGVFQSNTMPCIGYAVKRFPLNPSEYLGDRKARPH